MKKTLLLSFILGIMVFNSWAQRKPEPILTPEEYYTNAMSYKSKDNYTEAWRLLSKALTIEPNNTTYKMEMADIQYNRRAYFEAIPLYEEMLESDLQNMEYLTRLAEMYSMSPKKMKGIEYAERVLKLKPTDGNIHRTLARTFYEVQHYPKALAEYKEAEKTLTTDKDLPFKIAYCYMKLNDNQNARLYYEKSLTLDSENASKIYETAISCYETNYYKRALELFQMAEDKGYYKTKTFYDNWALTYLEMKEYDNAIAYYNKAREYAPYDKDINLSIAEVYMKKGDFGKSREVLDGLLEINPEDAEVIYTKGMTYYKAGNTGKAEQYFNRAFELDPSLKSLRYTKMTF